MVTGKSWIGFSVYKMVWDFDLDLTSGRPSHLCAFGLFLQWRSGVTVDFPFFVLFSSFKPSRPMLVSYYVNINIASASHFWT